MTGPDVTVLRGVSFQQGSRLNPRNINTKPSFGAIIVAVKPGLTALEAVQIQSLTVYPSDRLVKEKPFEDDQLIFTPKRVVGNSNAIGELSSDLAMGQLTPDTPDLRARVQSAIRQVKSSPPSTLGQANSMEDIDALLDAMDVGDDAFSLQMEHGQAPYDTFLAQAQVTHQAGTNTLVFTEGSTAGNKPANPNTTSQAVKKPRRRTKPKNEG